MPFQPWAKALFDDREKHELEPHARCKASGMTRQFLTPYGTEFVEIAELKRIYIFDVGGPHTFRTIYMDGRSHPKNLTPSYYGHSIGWWEGDTLVVDSVGFNESFWWDRRGLPHTEQLHFVERFTRTDSRNMRYEFTVDDPGAYTKPFSGTMNIRASTRHRAVRVHLPAGELRARADGRQGGIGEPIDDDHAVGRNPNTEGHKSQSPEASETASEFDLFVALRAFMLRDHHSASRRRLRHRHRALEAFLRRGAWPEGDPAAGFPVCRRLV